MHLVAGSEFLKIFCWAFAAVSIPLSMLLGGVGIMYGLGSALLLTPVIMLITGKLGQMAGRVYAGSAADATDRDLLLVELEKARVYLGRREYDKALYTVNVIVRKDPELPEALYLKANILWEGFRERDRAISTLDRLLSSTEAGSDYYKWSMNFRKELLSGKKQKETGEV